MFLAVQLILLLVAMQSSQAVVQLHGAGASFASDVFESWISTYRQYRKAYVDINMTYESVGSAMGIARIKGKELPSVDYAVSNAMLSEKDYEEVEELVMLPVTAGAIVLGYNVEGVENLNLTIDHLVGIYNGTITHWDDATIRDLNPSATLPAAEIKAIAHSDPSGTTEAFTRFLSKANANWSETFGHFLDGLDSNNSNTRWKPSVIKHYGNTNLGMTGIILSIANSIGYISVIDAYQAKIPFASIRNMAGNIVDATLDNVDEALNELGEDFEIRLLVGSHSYPIISFNYLVVRKGFHPTCSTSMELVRFIEWFYATESARDDCRRLQMAPMSKRLYTTVIDTVLKVLTCPDGNVYNLVQKQIQLEQVEGIGSQPWKAPVIAMTLALVILTTVLTILFFRKHQAMLKKLIKQPWNIAPADIDRGPERWKEVIASLDMPASIFQGHSSITGERVSHGTGTDHTPAVLNQSPVALFLHTSCNCDFRPNLTIKKKLLEYLDELNHVNVSKFLGIMELESCIYSVYENKTKGTLMEVLHGMNVEISTEGKIAAAMEIISGMRYLHKKNIVHGRLRASCCHLDINWKVKVAHWEETETRACKLHDRDRLRQESSKHHANLEGLQWTAPDLMKFGRQPTFSSDVYSFSITLKEIFSGLGPYDDMLTTMSISQLIEMMAKGFLRPNFDASIPHVVRSMMEKMWNMDPSQRPTFNGLHRNFSLHFPDTHNLIDYMIGRLETYSFELEHKIADVKSLSDFYDRTTHAVRRAHLPASIRQLPNVDELRNTSELFDSASIMAIQVDNISDLYDLLEPTKVADFLQSLFQTTDEICANSGTENLAMSGGTILIASGIPKPCENHGGIICSAAVLARVMIQQLIDSRDKSDPATRNLGVRIGVGTGGAYGIVTAATPVPSYAVVGQAMSLAWKMVRSSEPGTILISGPTRQCLPKERNFVLKERVSVTDSSEPPGYWLESSARQDGVFELFPRTPRVKSS